MQLNQLLLLCRISIVPCTIHRLYRPEPLSASSCLALPSHLLSAPHPQDHTHRPGKVGWQSLDASPPTSAAVELTCCRLAYTVIAVSCGSGHPRLFPVAIDKGIRVVLPRTCRPSCPTPLLVAWSGTILVPCYKRENLFQETHLRRQPQGLRRRCGSVR